MFYQVYIARWRWSSPRLFSVRNRLSLGKCFVDFQFQGKWEVGGFNAILKDSNRLIKVMWAINNGRFLMENQFFFSKFYSSKIWFILILQIKWPGYTIYLQEGRKLLRIKRKINPRSHGSGLQKQGKSTDYFNVLKLED